MKKSLLSVAGQGETIVSLCETQKPDRFIALTCTRIILFSQSDPGTEILSWAHGIPNPSFVKFFKGTDSYSIICCLSSRNCQVCLVTVRQMGETLVTVGSPQHVPLYPSFHKAKYEDGQLAGVHVSFHASSTMISVYSSLYNGDLTVWRNLELGKVSDYSLTLAEINLLENFYVDDYNGDEADEGRGVFGLIDSGLIDSGLIDSNPGMLFKSSVLVDITHVFSKSLSYQPPHDDHEAEQSASPSAYILPVYKDLNCRSLILKSGTGQSIDYFPSDPKFLIPSHDEIVANCIKQVSMDSAKERSISMPLAAKSCFSFLDAGAESPDEMIQFLEKHWERAQPFLPYLESSVQQQQGMELALLAKEKAIAASARKRKKPPVAGGASTSTSSSQIPLDNDISASQSAFIPMTQPVTKKDLEQVRKRKKKAGFR